MGAALDALGWRRAPVLRLPTATERLIQLHVVLKLRKECLR